MIFDVTKKHCYYFNEICKIPHGSYNEKQLSDWIVAFAIEHDLKYVQDSIYNVIIYKDGTPGYENHPGVIIQAHMDMVCAKKPESTHDFETDPLELHVEGDFLKANGTTLGGDDCMGVAYMLTILDDETLPHPYLECCFTVQEEVGLFGAMALKPEYFKARRLINLDGAGEYRTYTTLAGSHNMVIKKKLNMIKSETPAYQLRVSGLIGGRTGDDIDKERANAGKLVGRILCAIIAAGMEFRISSLDAGRTGKPGITTEASAIITSKEDVGAIMAVVEKIKKNICEEYELTEPSIEINLIKTSAEIAADCKESKEIAKLLYLLFYGVAGRFVHLNSLPYLSSNVGYAKLEGNTFELNFSARSPYEPAMAEMEHMAQILCEKLNAEIEDTTTYYGYRYRIDSPLRDTMDSVFQEQYGIPLNHQAAHGGNECGVFKHMFDNMDIVTTGAIYAKHHTPDEYLDLASFDRSIQFLKAFVSAL